MGLKSTTFEGGVLHWPALRLERSPIQSQPPFLFGCSLLSYARITAAGDQDL